MSPRLPRIAAIHDLAGFGRCSLTVILPVLSVLGAQACPVPTAVLSTHSGGFPGFTFHDLTDDMDAFRKHWDALGLAFDSLYSGFLGSVAQIDLVRDFFHTFHKNDESSRKKEESCILVDPVMGDNGKRYSTYTDDMQARMRLLVAEADIVTPNLTEAGFLLGESYHGEHIPLSEAREWLKRLADMGPRITILTGLEMPDRQGCNLAYDAGANAFWQVPYKQIPIRYPGTGDLFASVLLGCMLRGDSLPDAMDMATQYLSLTVGETYRQQAPVREGVWFEKTLPFLMTPLEKHTCIPG